MKTLDEIGLDYRTDKSSPYHNYLNTYEKYFKEFRDEPAISVWELGIGDINSSNREGESALVWRDYFTCSPTIRVFDNDPVKVARFTLAKDKIWSHCMDQTDKKGFESLVKEVGRPFIIIDDASHIQINTLTSFEALFPLLQSGGLYCIEDTVAPAYWESWGGQETIFDSMFMKYFSVLTHFINLEKKENFPNPPTIKIQDWVKEIESIHFYRSQIIIKKK